MHSNKHPLLFTLALSIFCFSNAWADIGSRHKNEFREHRSHPKRQKPTNQNLDIQKILPILETHAIGEVENTLGGHIDQQKLESLPSEEAFEQAFEEGDELFEIKYNALDGVGANVGNGNRFTSVPRLDLNGPTQWARITPHRITGPNSDSCLNCHSFPVGDGAGVVNDSAVRIDPDRKQKGFIERQSPHLHGMGAQQLLAEEMTTELQALRDNAISETCASRKSKHVKLTTKSVDFGSIHVRCKRINYQQLEGIDRSLVVKPFEWKGLTASVRDFARGAAHQELGMQATELVGHNDSDYDGITDELSVGDITALAVYMAAQPRPVSKIELNQIIDQLTDDVIEQYGLPLSSGDISSIERGQDVFEELQCASCHKPSMTVSSSVYFEPSLHPEYRDTVFPAGKNIRLPEIALEFDITKDLPNNPQLLPSGKPLGVFETNQNGEAIIRLYGDMKRHDMGPQLAETFDEGGLGHSVFITETLWGVGSTKPYLHDGRATTLTEAILYHGGEARQSRNAFKAASMSDREDLIAFLNNLVIILD